MPATATSAGFVGAWPAVAASVPEARRATLDHLRALSPELPLDGIALVLTEALANVVVHAYTGRALGELRVRVEPRDDGVQVTVEDDGRGLVPRLDSPGLGLGLPLMATLADRFDTTTEPDGGTRVCAFFQRAPGTATAGRRRPSRG